ncbi:MAG: hypothetical protein ACYDCL_14710 [Myxococcales bacterium]
MSVLSPRRRQEIVGRLARSLVHESKNVLNVMSLHVQALGDRARRGQPSAGTEVTRSLDSLRDQIVKVDGLVTRFARIATQPGGSKSGDLAEGVAVAIGLCEAEARQAHVTLEADLHPVRARLAPEALEELVVDLLFRLFELPELAGSALRVTFAANATQGWLELSAQSPLPRELAEGVRGPARQAGLELDADPGARCLRFIFAAAGAASGGPVEADL